MAATTHHARSRLIYEFLSFFLSLYLFIGGGGGGGGRERGGG